MNRKIALVSAITMMVSVLPVWAEEAQETVFLKEESFYAGDLPLFGRYPSEEAYLLPDTDENRYQHDVFQSTMLPGNSPAENVFTINDNGKKTSYVLLDKDSEGNYFVITETEFGQKNFTNLAKDSINKSDTLDSSWNFDPENASSIAYWLNNQFLSDGNGGLSLPYSIKKNILEKEWFIENNVVTDESIRQNDTSKQMVKDYRASRDGVRTVVSKLSLISLTEYNTYADKISAPATRSVDYDKQFGFMTRTIHSVVAGRGVNLTFSNYFLHVCGANDQDYVTCEINSDFDESYYVRPVFWLDKDFFKNEKIDLTTVGENVKAEVREHLYADLSEIYTDSELSGIGIDVTNLPKAENVAVSGLVMPNSTPVIKYSYSGEGAEGESLYEIYSVGENDELVLEDEQTGGWTIPEKLAGKTVKLAVIPSDNNGRMGARVWSDKFYVAESVGTVVSGNTFIDGDMNSVTSLSGISKLTAEVKINNADIADAPCTIAIVQYNSLNKIKKVQVVEVTALRGDNTFDVSLENVTTEPGDYVKVMVKSKSKPIYSKDIK